MYRSAPPSERFQFRSVYHCVPLVTKGYSTLYNSTTIPGMTFRRYNYGEIPGSGSNFTYEIPTNYSSLQWDNYTFWAGARPEYGIGYVPWASCIISINQRKIYSAATFYNRFTDLIMCWLGHDWKLCSREYNFTNFSTDYKKILLTAIEYSRSTALQMSWTWWRSNGKQYLHSKGVTQIFQFTSYRPRVFSSHKRRTTSGLPPTGRVFQ